MWKPSVAQRRKAFAAVSRIHWSHHWAQPLALAMDLFTVWYAPIPTALAGAVNIGVVWMLYAAGRMRTSQSATRVSLMNRVSA